MNCCVDKNLSTICLSSNRLDQQHIYHDIGPLPSIAKGSKGEIRESKNIDLKLASTASLQEMGVIYKKTQTKVSLKDLLRSIEYS